MRDIRIQSKNTLARRQERLALGLLLPTLFVVSLVIILPLLAIFWISFKPVGLADLNPATLLVRESLHTRGAEPQIRYKLRASNSTAKIEDAGFSDILPEDVVLVEPLPKTCTQDGRTLVCLFGDIDGKFRTQIDLPISFSGESTTLEDVMLKSEPQSLGRVDHILTNGRFTLENFTALLKGDEFFPVLGVTLFYTIFGTLGALIVGLFAAMLLNKSFKGQGVLRGLYLFSYVAPVIAVAFTWITLFDPFSGSVNMLLMQMGVLDHSINFFGERGLALVMVTLFEIWRYFPLSFIFILARMQSIDDSIYEAADMDGASPFQKFWHLGVPQLLGILSVLFLLRFIWTFNKFDDIFLLTGGNAGTRTLTVNVYEQAFAVSNIGAGAAVAVVIFLCLILFSTFFFKFLAREEGL